MSAASTRGEVVLQQTMYALNSTVSNLRREGRTRMFHAVAAVCSVWVKNIPYDFRDQAMLARMEELLSLCAVDEADRVAGHQLLLIAKSALNKLERYEKALGNLLVQEENDIHPSDTITGLFALCNEPLLIAHQLTHIELERFSMIGPDEIMYALMKGDMASIGKDELSGGVHSCVSSFNRLTSLVASEILRHSRKRHRASVMEWWVEVAKSCMDVGNFNSTMAIVAGLAVPAVARLRKTWARVEKDKLHILQHQLDPSGNFLSYRSTMKAAVWRAEGASSESEKIIIPFFVLLLKDLFLIYHGHPRILPNGHLNMEASHMLAEQIEKLVIWKSRTCSFPRLPALLQYLLVAPIHDETTLMMQSFEYEEPENTSEKDLYKKFKTRKS